MCMNRPEYDINRPRCLTSWPEVVAGGAGAGGGATTPLSGRVLPYPEMRSQAYRSSLPECRRRGGRLRSFSLRSA